MSKTAYEKVVVALDVETIEEAKSIILKLKGKVKYFKIGSILFTRYGPEGIDLVMKSGAEVFLDLKYHDIPNTVSLAAIEAARMSVWMFNMHIAGGKEMMETTVKEVTNFCNSNNSRKPLILGVTLLTSISDKQIEEYLMAPMNSESFVKSFALKAKEAGLDGVVASPKEITLIRKACGEKFIILTPGIRPAFASKDDQKRLSTPKEAVSQGSNFLVIGRPIIKADDPVKALDMISQELDR
jgi:orotidine-5'-phosphate decarboxylase